MKCHYCGTELSGSETFCRFCGTRQVPVPQAEPTVEWTTGPETPAADPYEFPMPKKAPVFDEETFCWKPTDEELEAEFPSFEPDVPAVPAPAPCAPEAQQPRLMLPTVRGLAKMFFLGILTLGIYPTVIWSRIVTELNIAASRHDGQRTMPYFAMVALSPITLGIFTLVWMHRLCRRIGNELARRNIDYKFGAKTFWLWNILGSLILVGPFIFLHKLMKSMNRINADFNING